jgi:hypothetical protein
MTPTNDVRLEIQRRIQTANRCFFRLSKHLQSSQRSRQTKFTIHKTLIYPVLLYGSEPWVLTKKEENQYLRGRFSQRYAARKSKMVPTGEGTTTNSIKSLNVTKTSRLRDAGHLIRRPKSLPQKTLFRAKPTRRRNQGRPKSRWADGVNSYSLDLGVKDWTHCAQDRQTWSVLLQQALTR